MKMVHGSSLHIHVNKVGSKITRRLYLYGGKCTQQDCSTGGNLPLKKGAEKYKIMMKGALTFEFQLHYTLTLNTIMGGSI